MKRFLGRIKKVEKITKKYLTRAAFDVIIMLTNRLVIRVILKFGWVSFIAFLDAGFEFSLKIYY